MNIAVKSRKKPVRAASARGRRTRPGSGATARPLALAQGNPGGGAYDTLTLILVVVCGVLWAMATLTDTALSDEGFHWSQIETFMDGGDFSVWITTLPGYHWTMTFFMKALSLESLYAARYLNWFLSLPALVCFYLLARRGGAGNPSALTLQLFLAPIIFQFFFLVYTDTVSLSLVLLSLVLTLDRRYRLAGLVAGVSILFRQTNIMWLFLCWMLALSDTGFFASLKGFRRGFKAPGFRELAEPLRITYLFPVFCLVFVGFVILNRGVALGDAETHSLRSFYPTQVFMLLLVLFFLFLPMQIRNAPAIWRMLKSRPVLSFVGAILYAIYMATFYVDHDYNYHSFYARNWLLDLVREDAVNRSLLFIPMLWAFYGLLLTPFRERKYYWFYPVTIMYLLPIALIEPRYFIVPVVLFMLFRKPSGDYLEYLTAGLYIPFTMFIFIETAAEKFFI